MCRRVSVLQAPRGGHHSLPAPCCSSRRPAPAPSKGAELYGEGLHRAAPMASHGGGGAGGRPTPPCCQNRCADGAGNLAPLCRADEVRAKFERYGAIRDVYLPKDFCEPRCCLLCSSPVAPWAGGCGRLCCPPRCCMCGLAASSPTYQLSLLPRLHSTTTICAGSAHRLRAVCEGGWLESGAAPEKYQPAALDRSPLAQRAGTRVVAQRSRAKLWASKQAVARNRSS